jgi:hypothetical protein
MKFKLWIDIKQISFDNEDNWVISYCVHDAIIYKEEFFIPNYNINTYIDEENVCKTQTIKFNKKLDSIIQKLLLPKSNTNYFGVSKLTAWDYYHYTLHIEGFKFAVHPMSMSNTYLRQEFEGTQEEIYEKCLELNTKYISKNNLI